MSNKQSSSPRTPAQSDSPEGKAISSKNAVKHGLRARQLHLAPDEQETFKDLRDIYHTHYLPADPFESHVVDQCVMAAWLLARAQTIQASLLDLELAEAGPDIEETYTQIDRPGLLAIGFRLLNERTSAYSTLDAHQARLLRQITRFTSLLESTRKQRQHQPTAVVAVQDNKPANEPEPLVS
jgi:hypothetical protein